MAHEDQPSPNPATTVDPGSDPTHDSSGKVKQNAAKDDPAIPERASSSDDVSGSSTDDDEEDDADDGENMKTNDAAGENNDEDALLQATLLKEEGNTHYQNGKWDEAARCYRRGSNRLKKVSGIDADPQVKALQLTLQTNLSMVLFKQEKFRASRNMASKALSLDDKHVKALYRRAVACRAMGDLDQAKSDLRAALLMDSTNASCKRELAAVKKQLETTTQQQKAALAKAFSSGGKSSFLYTDKEEEERQKQLEKERKRQEKEKRKLERKKDWEDECVKRMAKGDKAISFDEWEKELEAMEKKRKDEGKKKREKERKERQVVQSKSSSSSTRNKAGSSNDDDDDDDELTEQELASLRGYKKTKDGRTTSYFTRELSEEEKQRMGDMAPKMLNDSVTSSVTTTTTTSADAASSAARASAWNQAGTWEEKDCTPWCKDELTQRLLATTTNSAHEHDYQAKVVEVKELTGEGSVAISGGKKRYIFDFHAQLKFDIHNTKRQDGTDGDGDDAIVASGVVRLPDICSTHYDDDELEVTFDSSWTKAPKSSQHQQPCMDARERLATDLRASVQGWVQAFNQQF